MTDRTVAVRVQARDEASAAFERVGDAARTMGDAVKGAADNGARSIESFSTQVKRLESEINTVGKTLAGFGAAGIGLFALGVRDANNLEAAMRKVNSIAGLSDRELKALTGTIRQLGVSMGIADPTELADALYDIQGSGFEAAEAMTILNTAVVSGRAGLTNTATAATAITAVLNAYGKSANDAGNVSDILFATVDSGVISFGALANSLGRTLPLAAQLKVPLEQLAAAYAQLTLVGINPSEAETGIAALMTAAINPTEAMTRALKEYGFVSAEAILQTQGLAGFLDFLMLASNGSTSALSDLLGNVRATNAALALGRDDGAGYADALRDMEGAAQGGARTLGVFGEMSNTTKAAIDGMVASLRDVGITMGNAIQPGIAVAANAVRSLADSFRALPEPLQAAISVIGVATAGTALLSGTLLLAIPRIVAFRAAMATLGTTGGPLATMTTLATRANLVGVALTGLALVAAPLIARFMESGRAAREYAGSLLTLGEAIEMVRRRGDTRLANLAQEAADLGAAYKQAAEEVISGFQFLDDYIQQRVGEGNLLPSPGSAEYNRYKAEWETVNAVNAEAADSLKVAGEEITAFNALVREALSDSNIDAAAWLEWSTGLINAAQLTKDLADDALALQTILDRPLSDFSIHIGGVADGLNETGEAARFANRFLIESITWVGELAEKYEDFEERLDRFNQAHIDWLSEGQNILAFWTQYQDAFNVGAAAIDTASQSLSPLAAGVQSLQSAFADGSGGLARSFRELVDIAREFGTLNASFDQVLRTFDQIDQLGQRPGRAGGIAEALVGEPGELAAIDELLKANRISLEQYTATVASGYAIQDSVARQQLTLNEIRADQLPLLEAETAAYERNLETIASLAPVEQRRVLMLQDTAVQSQIAGLYAQAYAASVGEIPREVATSLILNAAEADAGLKDILLNLGLIAEDEYGIHVIFPEGETVQASVQALTASIDALTIALGGVPPSAQAAGDAVLRAVDVVEGADGTTALMRIDHVDEATPQMHEVRQLWEDTDGTMATLTINALDWASERIAAVARRMANLNGTTATVEIREYFDRTRGFALGGVVQPERFAHGGVANLVPIWAGELGPEVAHFASGGTALLPREGLYAVPPMTYISPHTSMNTSYGGVTINAPLAINAPIYGVDDLNAWWTGEALPSLADELNRHRVAAGVV